MLNKIIDHIRNHSYMSGVERDNARIKATGEVFTPTALVQEILEKLPIEQFKDPTKTFLDPTCGDGQFLGEVIIRKMENGSTFEEALSTTYGVDKEESNVDLCRKRLLCGHTEYKHIVENNIREHNALEYDFGFDGIYEKKQKAIKKKKDETDSYNDEVKNIHRNLFGFE